MSGEYDESIEPDRPKEARRPSAARMIAMLSGLAFAGIASGGAAEIGDAARSRARERARHIGGVRPMPFQGQPLVSRTPTDKADVMALAAADEKRARKAAKRARNDARREAGRR